MLNTYLNRKFLIGFILALALMVLLAIYSYQNRQRLIYTSRWVAHTHEVLHHAQRLLAVAINVEICQRGYTLTGNEEFLRPFTASVNQIKDDFQNLRALVRDNDRQVQRVAGMQGTIDELIGFSSLVVETRKKSFNGALELNNTMRGKIVLDQIRNDIRQLEAEEKRLLDERVRENEEQIRKFNFSFIGLLAVTALILVGLVVGINHNLKVRYDAEARLLNAARQIQDLYDNAPCGYHSLNADGVFVEINNTLLGWLGYERKEEVIGSLNFIDVISPNDMDAFRKNFPSFKERGYVHNIEFSFKRRDGSEFPVVLSSTAIFDQNGSFLKSRSNTFDNTERKVAETKIVNLNRELEAFTYSVSHDLRAPLRSIDGYARILSEDYCEKLDGEGKRLINVVVNNANRMGKLIDDLLDFSRLGRKEVQRTSIDMEQMAKSIAAEAVAATGERKVSVVVQHLDRCDGDIDMIRQVWVNLIENAVKYTGKNPDARIEISSARADGEVHYRIADNGVGFDMQYLPKLFGVFQRLHRIQDFAGTGVGLAIVKRIINRHNGNVWAEGKVDQGATFHFTIPIDNGK